MVLHVLLEDVDSIESYCIPISSIEYIKCEYKTNNFTAGVKSSIMTINFKNSNGSIEIETKEGAKSCFRILETIDSGEEIDALYESNAISGAEKDLLACMSEINSITTTNNYK